MAKLMANGTHYMHTGRCLASVCGHYQRHLVTEHGNRKHFPAASRRRWQHRTIHPGGLLTSVTRTAMWSCSATEEGDRIVVEFRSRTPRPSRWHHI